MNTLKRALFEPIHPNDYTRGRNAHPRLSLDLAGRSLRHKPVTADDRDDTVDIDTIENVTCVKTFSPRGGLLWCRPAISLCDDIRKRSTCNSDENITKETYVSHDLLMDAVDHYWRGRGFAMRWQRTHAVPRLTNKKDAMFHHDEQTISPTVRVINDWTVAGVLNAVQNTTSFSCGADIAMGSISRKILGPVSIKPRLPDDDESTAHFNVPADVVVDIDELIRQRGRNLAKFPFWSTRGFDQVKNASSHDDNHQTAKFYIVVYNVPFSVPDKFFRRGRAQSSAVADEADSERRARRGPLLSMAIVRSISYRYEAILNDIHNEIQLHFSRCENQEYTGSYFAACQEIGYAMPVALNRSRYRVVLDKSERRRMIVDDFRIDLSNSRWITQLIDDECSEGNGLEEEEGGEDDDDEEEEEEKEDLQSLETQDSDQDENSQIGFDDEIVHAGNIHQHSRVKENSEELQGQLKEISTELEEAYRHLQDETDQRKAAEKETLLVKSKLVIAETKAKDTAKEKRKKKGCKGDTDDVIINDLVSITT